uniref:Uncharacterized protein n=1 Tax=Myotis myotis TaxID=51298 RepID=A0A7J7T673_MYOMY|nr:hypothetical protein mMyoMyo1_009162 [Myotis myotis]
MGIRIWPRHFPDMNSSDQSKQKFLACCLRGVNPLELWDPCSPESPGRLLRSSGRGSKQGEPWGEEFWPRKVDSREERDEMKWGEAQPPNLASMGLKSDILPMKWKQSRGGKGSLILAGTGHHPLTFG